MNLQAKEAPGCAYAVACTVQGLRAMCGVRVEGGFGKDSQINGNERQSWRHQCNLQSRSPRTGVWVLDEGFRSIVSCVLISVHFPVLCLAPGVALHRLAIS